MAETPSVPPLLTATHTSDGRLILFYVKALYDYAADNGSEIHFKMGDIIAVTDTPDDGWWKGELCDETRRRRGRDVFPSNYTVVLGPDEEEVVVCTGDGQPTLFYAKALKDYSATGDNDFDFKAGDIIAITHAPPGGRWWRGDLLDETRRQPGRDMLLRLSVSQLGKRGEALPTASHTSDGRLILFYVKALYDYVATQPDDGEIDFIMGDIIAVTDTPEDGWWKGELCDETRRQHGRDVFPRNYTAELGPDGEVVVYADACRATLFYAKALNDYSATDDNDFDFKAGDIIAITHAPPGGRWWRGELLDETRRQPGRDMLLKLYVIELGKPGEALPSPHVRVYTNDGWSVLFYVRALYNYSATDDEEFDLRAGDIIAVTDAPKDGWWSGELLDETRRESGRDVFPSNYVRLI